MLLFFLIIFEVYLPMGMLDLEDQLSDHHIPLAPGGVGQCKCLTPVVNNQLVGCNVVSICISVPAILNEAVPATTQSVDTEIQATLKCAYEYTSM